MNPFATLAIAGIAGLAALAVAHPAGAAPGPDVPRIEVDGRIVSGTVVVTNIAGIQILGGATARYFFYSLDGTEPGFGLPYTRPFQVERTAVIRALAFDAGFARLAEATPVTVEVVAQHPPAIVQQPRDELEAIGNTATLAVAASGTPPLAFQWLHDGVPVVNATGAVLRLPDVQALQAGLYAAVVANAFGAVTSRLAVITVLSKPVIAAPPVRTTVNPDSLAILEVVAAGPGPYRYQWRKTGVAIPGATNSTLSFPAARVTDGGRYDVVIANAVGTIRSAPVELVVRTALNVFGGDNLLAPITLDSASFRFAVSGFNTNATRQAGEPDHGGKRGSNSVWFRWTAPAAGVAEFRTAGSSFDTLLGVYRGRSIDTLSVVARGEDNGEYLSSVARFNAEAGAVYAIAVDGFAGDTGRFVLSWDFAPTTSLLPVIVMSNQPPAARTVRRGARADFAVSLDPAGPPSDVFNFQWHFNGQPIRGATGLALSIPSAQPENVGDYHLAISNRQSSAGIVTEYYRLEVGTQTNAFSVDKYQDLFAPASGGSGRGGGGAPEGLMLATATGTGTGLVPLLYIRSDEVDSHFVNFALSTSQSGDPNDCGISRSSARSRYWSLESAVTGTCFLNTYGSRTTNEIILAVYLESGSGTLQTPIASLACSVGSPETGGAVLHFNVKTGERYRVFVDGQESGTDFLRLNWGVNAQSVPSADPGAQTILLGGIHTFATADFPAGTEVKRYEWRYNGMRIPGATNRTLTLTNVQPADAGAYEVVIELGTALLTNLVGRLVVDTSTRILAISTFDLDSEGWTVTTGAATPQYLALGGNPQGCISALGTNRTGTSPWYWIAPPGFLGDRRMAYGGYLRFDLRQSASNAPLSGFADVQFTGSGGRSASFRSTTIPGVNWTSLLVPLVESAPGWTNAGTLPEFLDTLRGLTAIQLRGQFSLRTNWISLDNVMLVDSFHGVPLPDSPLRLEFRPLGSALILELPPWRAPLLLETTDVVTNKVWDSYPPQMPSRAPSPVEFEMSQPGRFFRLRQW